jgi:hypothetical protein
MLQIEGAKPVRLEQQVRVWRLNGACSRSGGDFVHIFSFREIGNPKPSALRDIRSKAIRLN